jgi:hypothetical protein
MNLTSRKSTSTSSLLGMLGAGALGLAASPAALANDRGGPGQPGSQQAASHEVSSLPWMRVRQRLDFRSD